MTIVLEEAILSVDAGLFLFLCSSSFFGTVIYTRWLQSSYLYETVEIVGSSSIVFSTHDFLTEEVFGSSWETNPGWRLPTYPDSPVSWCLFVEWRKWVGQASLRLIMEQKVHTDMMLLVHASCLASLEFYFNPLHTRPPESTLKGTEFLARSTFFGQVWKLVCLGFSSFNEWTWCSCLLFSP